MKNYLEKLPKEVKELLYLARDAACAEDVPVYLVGGFVRDLILGVENLDLDIVVEGEGIKFAERLADKLSARLVRHKRFGTATVKAGDHLKIDVASARKERYPKPGHLPEVTSSTLQDDLYRRDFTINAMAIDIGCKGYAKLIDFFGGKADIDKKKVRILHFLSFIDDPTRILRAIRFEKRYAFKIETTTLKRLKESISLKMLEKVEPQRIRGDLILMLKENNPLKGLLRLSQLAGFDFINKNLKLSARNLGLLRSIEKQIFWFERIFTHRRKLDVWLLYFMGLIGPLSKKDAEYVCKKFAFGKGEEKRILFSKKIDKRTVSALSKKIRPSQIYSILEPLSYESIIFIKAKYRNIILQSNIERFLRDYNGVRIHLSGHDLNALGLKPGPSYQRIFKKVLCAKLNGLVKTKEDELSLARKAKKWS